MDKGKRRVRTKTDRIAAYKAKIAELEAAGLLEDARAALKTGKIFDRDAKEMRRLLRHVKAMNSAAKAFSFHGVDEGVKLASELQAIIVDSVRSFTDPSDDEALLRDSDRLWKSYEELPSKKRIRHVLSHLERMLASDSGAVKSERARILRKANKAARELGVE